MKRKLQIALSGMVLFAGVTTAAFSQVADKEDFDNYHLRIDTGWYYSDPSGSLHGSASTDNASIDFNKDLGFNSYSTFSGKADWKFTRKNHLYVSVIPFNFQRQTVLNRTITFQGQTFTTGLTTNSSLDTLFVAPGYQYDIIRRRRGHLGIALQMDLFNTTGKISAAAQVTGDGVHHNAVSATGSLLAPIPCRGARAPLLRDRFPKGFHSRERAICSGMEALCPRQATSESRFRSTSPYSPDTSWHRISLSRMTPIESASGLFRGAL